MVTSACPKLFLCTCAFQSLAHSLFPKRSSRETRGQSQEQSLQQGDEGCSSGLAPLTQGALELTVWRGLRSSGQMLVDSVPSLPLHFSNKVQDEQSSACSSTAWKCSPSSQPAAAAIVTVFGLITPNSHGSHKIGLFPKSHPNNL